MSDLHAEHFVLASACEDEIVAAAEYYRGEGGDELALRCTNEIIGSIAKIRANLLIGAPVQGAPANWRRIKTGHFPFFLYYTVDAQNNTLFIFSLSAASQRKIPTISMLRHIAGERKHDTIDLGNEQ